MQLPPYEIFPSRSCEKIILREILDSDINDLVAISFYDAQQANTAQ